MKQQNIPWELIISKLKQEITEEDNEKLMHWADNPECQAVLEDLKVLWHKIQTSARDYTPDKDYYWKELSVRMNRSGQSVKKMSVKKSISFQSLYRFAVAACIVLVVSMGLSYYWGANTEKMLGEEQVYTCINGKSKVSLPDGTNVWLHDNTTLTCGQDFQERNRLVRISGEAYFEVAKDEKKAFIVEIEGMRVVVHGTKFNVDAPANVAESRVSLVEGSVSLETPAENLFLRPGEIAVYDIKNRKLDIADGDVAFEMLWANDKVTLSDKSLGDVCRILSQWYGVEINVEDGLKDKYKYTFTLRHEPLEEIIRLMSRINPISYSFDENNVLTISAGPQL